MALVVAHRAASRAPTSILEIGGGHGRLGHALLSVYPEATYAVVDIEPALTISRWYLSGLFPQERLRFLAPHEADRLEPGSIDVGVAISSLHEMTAEQVTEYLQLLDRVAAGGAVYLVHER